MFRRRLVEIGRLHERCGGLSRPGNVAEHVLAFRGFGILDGLADAPTFVGAQCAEGVELEIAVVHRRKRAHLDSPPRHFFRFRNPSLIRDFTVGNAAPSLSATSR